ncbi:MAG: hypothetical protein DRP16_06105, partial [Candidatus Aenigmatarchaeota archaeon]
MSKKIDCNSATSTYLRIWLNYMDLGMKILERKLRTKLFGHPSQERIKEYKTKLNSYFDNLEEFVFKSEMQSSEGETVKLITYKDDNLYAPCIKQILGDHFQIQSEISRTESQHKVIISNGNKRREI